MIMLCWFEWYLTRTKVQRRSKKRQQQSLLKKRRRLKSVIQYSKHIQLLCYFACVCFSNLFRLPSPMLLRSSILVLCLLFLIVDAAGFIILFYFLLIWLNVVELCALYWTQIAFLLIPFIRWCFSVHIFSFVPSLLRFTQLRDGRLTILECRKVGCIALVIHYEKDRPTILQIRSECWLALYNILYQTGFALVYFDLHVLIRPCRDLNKSEG